MSIEASALAAGDPAGDDEYQAFYAVLAATARGRAFLEEHARRMRHAETEVLLAAVKRLENQVAVQAAAPAPAAPLMAEVSAALETVRSARAQIDAVQLSATVTQLVSALDTVQRRLSALLPAAPAGIDEPAPPPVQPPFALAITAVAAQASAAVEPEEEPIKVIKAGSMPPPPVFEDEDFSAGDSVSPRDDFSAEAGDAFPSAEPDIAETAEDLDIANAPAPASDEDPLGPLMALSEEERLALFS